jgi:transposase
MSSGVIYSERIKREVILQIISGKLNKSEARLRYKIGGKMTIDRWLQRYGYKDFTCLKTTMSKFKNPLRKTSLEEELERAQLKIKFLEAMIDLAKIEYDIDIKKTLESDNKDFIKNK